MNILRMQPSYMPIDSLGKLKIFNIFGAIQVGN